MFNRLKYKLSKVKCWFCKKPGSSVSSHTMGTTSFIEHRLKDVSKILDDISKQTGQVFIVMHSDTIKPMKDTENWPHIRDILENRCMLYEGHRPFQQRF